MTKKVFGIFLVLLSAIAFAAVLSFYGRVTGMITVKQSIVINNSVCRDIYGTGCNISEDLSLYGGENTTSLYNLSNRAGVGIRVNISFTGLCEPNETGDGKTCQTTFPIKLDASGVRRVAYYVDTTDTGKNYSKDYSCPEYSDENYNETSIEVTLLPHTYYPLCIFYEFRENALKGDYVINTTVLPVQE